MRFATLLTRRNKHDESQIDGQQTAQSRSTHRAMFFTLNIEEHGQRLYIKALTKQSNNGSQQTLTLSWQEYVDDDSENSHNDEPVEILIRSVIYNEYW